MHLVSELLYSGPFYDPVLSLTQLIQLLPLTDQTFQFLAVAHGNSCRVPSFSVTQSVCLCLGYWGNLAISLNGREVSAVLLGVAMCSSVLTV